jgi:hypothetical protein
MRPNLPFALVVLLLSGFMCWLGLTNIEDNRLKDSIRDCSQNSMRFQGVERVRAFVVALDKIRPGLVSGAMRREFEHYKALWNESLADYDKTGRFGDLDKKIAASAKRHNGL